MHPLFTVSPMFAVSEDFTPKGIGSSIFCRFEAVQVAGGTRFHRRVVVTLGFVPQAGFRFSIPVSTLVVAVFAFVGCYHIFVSVDHPPNKTPEPTAVGHRSSAVAAYVVSRRWLSFFR